MRPWRTFSVLFTLVCTGCVSTGVREDAANSGCDLSQGVQLTRPGMPQSIELLANHDAVIEAMGTPRESLDLLSFCAWSNDQRLDSITRVARYDGLEFSFVKPDGRSAFLLQEVRLVSDEFAVTCGLKVGDTVDRLLGRAGSPRLETIESDTEHRILKYVIGPSGSRLSFVVSEGKVVEIRAWTPCNIQADS